MDTLSTELRSMLKEIGELPEDFSAAADFYADLGMPSMKAMQLLMELETRFEVSIPDEDFVEATTLDKIEALIRRLRDGAGL